MKNKKSSLKEIYTNGPDESFIKEKDSWTTIIFCDPFSIPLARLFAKFKKIHPNYISILAMICGFIAAYFFFRGLLIYGSLVFLLKFILDGTDGKLARLTNTKSKTGEKIDYYTDIIGNIPMYFGLWYSQFYIFNKWFFGGSFIALHYLTMAFGYIFLKKLSYKTIFPRVSSYYIHIDEGFLTFFIAPLTGYFIYVFPILVLIQLVSYIILCFTQKEKPDFKKNIKRMLKL
jgi:phosphatidylglycerophosphate synthase